VRITTRNATFQRWQSLLTNRTKRYRAGEFLVHGVRPISQAVSQGWTITALLHDGRPNPSAWAKELLASVPATTFTVAPELMAELGEKSESAPELLAVARMRGDDFARLPADLGLLAVVFDRPASPGNVGTLIRSIDAFGGSGLVVTGHAADPYDPRCIRASTGSFFSVPVLRVPSHREVLAWLAGLRSGGLPVTVIGTAEDGTADVRPPDLHGAGLHGVRLHGPTVIVIGNETTGLAAAWREECDVIVRIPMAGTASSLNAATAGSIVLYESMRQRSAS
jgi:23S rRNA (uridine2479-2'-O)-methyltransferase